ncbi:ANTAR domain-containing protein [Pseudarthrobacter sp. NamE2]|uniref:GAF and ANTAR domain-containing protein n=1 Tax=Pseudarthrobacter sp. NamE2 TaxID=2576838 RepID=UPI0010FD2ED0|nr:ANTAR domain-containing protein [Pseudarthrobacter sp. NamE2]TLM82952.1 ANTAR domain-containing protein [Pseudarthrobacter sp. NamE2]
MHARHVNSGFPVHRTRVLSGAGDEESFETKDSPPAVAGPLLAPRSPAGRTAPPLTALAKQPGTGSQDLLLDLVTGTESLAESLQRLVNASVQSVIRTAALRIECGVVVHQPKKAPAIMGTSDEAVQLLQWEYKAAEGPVSEVLEGGQPVAVLQRNGDFRWPRYCDQLQSAGLGSVLGVRLALDSAPDEAASRDGAAHDGAAARETPAALAFFAQDAKAFPLQVIAEARSFAGLAAKSLQMAINLHTARSMASDLRSALDSRTSINVACGVIMAQNRCSYHEAFSILAKASSHRNIKVRRIAEDILQRLPEGAPRAHFGH